MDDNKPQGPSEDAPVWVKNPKTGEVGPLWKPEDLSAARANGYIDASKEERDAEYQQRQVEGWKGKVAAGAAGVADVVPFARNVVRSVAPELGEDVDRSAEAHPWIHGAAELATIAATAGIGGETAAAGKVAETGIGTVMEAALPAVAEKAIIAEGVPGGMRIALQAVEGALAKKSAEAAAERGVSAAVPSLAARVLGRAPEAARNATAGLGYGALSLTNEKDLGHSPEEVASHVMGTLFWSTVGGVVGGELMHGITKAASPVVEATGRAFGKAGEALDNLAAALKVGDGAGVVSKARSALQGGFDAMDQMAKQKVIDRGMEQVRKKVGDAGMGELDAQRIAVEEAFSDARANVMRLVGIPVTERGETVRKISADKVAKALKSENRQDVIEALQKLHEAGKGLQDFHETLAKAGATGLEGLSGKVADQVNGLLEVQEAFKKGLITAEEKGGVMEALKAVAGGEIGGAVAEHFGHHVLGQLIPAYGVVKAARMAWKMAPAEWQAARLSQLARLGAGVDAHLERVASALHSDGIGKYAAPAVASMSAADLRKLRDDVQQKLANPQLAMDHLQERAGVVNDFAPEAYGQMGLQYGAQLQALAGILQWPELPGPYSPQWTPSASETAKMSRAVAIVKDPRVFEASLAKGTATPAEAAVYKQAHGPRAAALTAKFAAGIKESAHKDGATLRAMTGMMVMGITPRASYSQPMLQSIQGLYAQRASQQGGPGSRGGTGGAKALTASQMISLPGQRVANRPPK